MHAEHMTNTVGRVELRHIRPNAITCSTALGACDRGSLWRQALQLLKEIFQRGQFSVLNGS